MDLIKVMPKTIEISKIILFLLLIFSLSSKKPMVATKIIKIKNEKLYLSDHYLFLKSQIYNK